MVLSKDDEEPAPRPTEQGAPGGTATDSGPLPVEWERLARIYVHPIRISILEVLGIDGGRVLSPTDLSRELRTTLDIVGYHVIRLAEAGLIVRVRQEPAGGAIENFYRLA
ncbi:MAG TPA: helix-turn-helix domain-containing protein [Solirubrobacterales bacterium]|jgi:DNA-binding transcriptional ArsR family regulator|nr:helix-turn-helix domain-containing protein [Solirubrobacterales bacterium]